MAHALHGELYVSCAPPASCSTANGIAPPPAPRPADAVAHGQRRILYEIWGTIGSIVFIFLGSILGIFIVAAGEPLMSGSNSHLLPLELRVRGALACRPPARRRLSRSLSAA